MIAFCAQGFFASFSLAFCLWWSTNCRLVQVATCLPMCVLPALKSSSAWLWHTEVPRQSCALLWHPMTQRTDVHGVVMFPMTDHSPSNQLLLVGKQHIATSCPSDKMGGLQAMLGPVLLKGQWRGHGKTFGSKNSSLTPTQTMINDNGCCTNECKEIIALPEEVQKELRKGIDKGNQIFKKGRFNLKVNS